jgi:DNA mismatch repair protein MutS2
VLEDFLDRAVRARYPSVRIVHGIGSGALKRAVESYLSSSPYCAAFRPGAPAEGGAGVTVAELAGGR